MFARSGHHGSVALCFSKGASWVAYFESEVVAGESRFPYGEERELDGPITLNADGKFVIPTKSPRTVSDVEQEIVGCVSAIYRSQPRLMFLGADVDRTLASLANERDALLRGQK